ncbi:hypothetical protein ABGT15_04200 [Flavobacterium enshiense]|uniref:hypothetical protein n=1 Tax=Flavobacterium enshiense TaxID=1341165 RepID=UPI00345D0117
MKKKNTNKFDSDLKWGQFIEWETIPFIEKTFNEVLIKRGEKMRFIQENISTKKNELKKWDLKFGIYKDGSPFLEREIYFEIKGDKFDETGNLFFEKSCSKKDSGVFATEANFFVYFLPRYKSKNFYLVKPKDLIELLTTKYASCLSYDGGDGGRVLSYLVTKSDFDEDFVKVGKLLDCSITIPDYFGLEKFKEKSKTTYQSDFLKCYENPLD